MWAKYWVSNEQIAAEYEDGSTPVYLGAKYGVSIPTILRAIKAGGGKMRIGGRPKKPADKKWIRRVERMRQQGMSYAEIGEALNGISRQAVRQRLEHESAKEGAQ